MGKDGFGLQKQEGCVLTTGGPDYIVHGGPIDAEFGKADSKEAELFKSGTTPLFTMFYNEPWNNNTTGPVPFLDTPEVHLSCLTRVVTESDRTSGAPSMHIFKGSLSLVWLSLSTLLWMWMSG